MSLEKKLILHQGIYKEKISVSSAVFMITGMTIGAGIFGIPYVVSRVGLALGIGYIILLGLLMLLLNLLIGEIVVRTRDSFQLPGLAGKYLGNWAKVAMSIMVVLGGLGALLAYLIGEGESLANLFGGTPEWWAVIFWTVGSFSIWRGLQTVKVLEKFFSVVVLSIVIGLSLGIMPQAKWENFYYYDLANLFLPFGVILFALQASPAIAEAHALLPDDQKKFKKALIIGTLIPVVVYILFAVATVSVLGLNTTPIVSVALGEKFGWWVKILINMFAVFAMGSGFLGLGLAMKQTLIWDWKVSPFSAILFTIVTPLTLYMLGWHDFLKVIGLIGGVLLGLEALILVFVYLRAQHYGDLPAVSYGLRHKWWVAIALFLLFTTVIIASIINLIKF
jgi:amino acid permease